MELVGRKFGRLTVIAKAAEPGRVVCRCDCGKLHDVLVGNLTRSENPTLSCGCLRSEVSTENGKRVCYDNFAEHLATTRRYGTSIERIERRTVNKNNRTGHSGVWFDRKRGVYQAYIIFHRKKRHIGVFQNLEDAVKAREEAERQLFDPVIARKKAEEAQYGSYQI